MRRTNIGLAIMLLVGVPVLAQSGRESPNSHIDLVPEEIAGIALYPDGETPVEDLAVRVWSVDDQKMIYRTRTDAEGIFRIPRVRQQRIYVFVGRVRVDLRMLSAENAQAYQHHDLIIVVPRNMLVLSGARIMDILIAPMLLKLPDPPRVVSP